MIRKLFAMTAGAALLGAPLVQAFAVICLSDALTTWGAIAKRLELAAEIAGRLK